MPFHTNTIDEFEFEDMRGQLQPKARQLEVMVRLGHDGESVRNTGVRAKPSQVVTVHYVEDWDAAKAAIEAYCDLIGHRVEVTQHSTDYGYFKVLDVVQVGAQACSSVVGSILTNPTVLHIVQWTLVSTDAP